MRFIEQREIESISFAAHASIASDLRTFLKVIKANPAVESLQERLRAKSFNIDGLVKVMQHLCDLKFDAEYENPADTALTTYAWILTNVDPASDLVAIDLLLKLKNSWWSRHLARRLLEQQRNKTLVL